jgi:hypothetical protein
MMKKSITCVLKQSYEGCRETTLILSVGRDSKFRAIAGQIEQMDLSKQGKQTQ